MSSKGVKPFYAMYVEKELVGKRVKSSKVKVLWKFACGPKLTTQEIQLKHSLVSGKKEVRLNGNVVFSNKMGGDKSDTLRKSCIVPVGDITATIFIEDGTNGYVYDLLLDGIQFHKADRISVSELEKLRANTQEKPKVNNTHRIDYNEFVNKGAKESNALDAVASKPKEEQTPEINLLDGYDTTPALGNPVVSTTVSSGAGSWPMFDSPKHDAEWRPSQSTTQYPFVDSSQNISTNTNLLNGFSASNGNIAQASVTDPFSVQHMQYKPSNTPYTSTIPTNEGADSIAKQLESLDFGRNVESSPFTETNDPYQDYTTNAASSYTPYSNGQTSGAYPGTVPNAQYVGLDNVGAANGNSTGLGSLDAAGYGKAQDFNPFQQASQPPMIAPQQKNTGAPQYQDVNYGNQQNLNPFA